LLIYPPTLAVDAPTDPSSRTVQLACKSFSLRAAAYAIDMVILIGVSRALTPLLQTSIPLALHYIARVLHLGFQFVPLPSNTSNIQMWAGFLLILFYLIVFEWIYGASIGKIILHMRVVMEDGSPCRLGPAAMRGLLRLIDGLFFGIIAYWTMRQPLYQRVGDKVAKTIVVGIEEIPNRRRLLSWRLLVSLALCPLLVVALNLGVLALRVTQVQYLVTSQANRINLQAKDLGRNYSLRKEYGKESFPDKTYWDANQRTFDSPRLTVESRVLLKQTYVNLSDSQLTDSIASTLQEEIKDVDLQIDKSAQVGVGEHGWAARFVDKTNGQEGYEIVFIRQNVLSRLIFYGQPGAITIKAAVSLADQIDRRIITGVYPPLEGNPLF
jgi:uncharacterized RDD family membrane protein YckC